MTNILNDILSIADEMDEESHEWNINGDDTELFQTSATIMDLYKDIETKQNKIHNNQTMATLNDQAKLIFRFYGSLTNYEALKDHLQHIAHQKKDIIARMQTVKDDDALSANFSSQKNICDFMKKIPFLLNESSSHNSNFQWIKTIESESEVLNNFADETLDVHFIEETLQKLSTFRENFNALPSKDKK